MRPRGTGSVSKRGRFWQIRYSVNGVQHIESTGSTSERVAKDILKKRLADITLGRAVGPSVDRTSFEDLVCMLLDDYRAERRKSVERVTSATKRLSEYFGGYLAKNITADRVTAYKSHRLEQGAAPATANNELAALRRMFTLALRAKRVAEAPYIGTPAVQNARQGFFEAREFQAVLVRLPVHVQPVARFGYLSGWRLREILGLQWRQVDLKAGIVRLEPGTTKNNQGRELPLWADPEMMTLFEEQWRGTGELEKATGRVIPWVFHYPQGVRGRWAGQPVRSFYSVWRRACKDAGCPGRLFHDLRRTAVRAMERAGVPRSVAMTITGHKTEAIYKRYAIATNADRAEGLKLLARQRAGSAPAERHSSGRRKSTRLQVQI